MAEFRLIVETDAANHRAEFRLKDESGAQLGYQAVALPDHGLSYWEGLFDTRKYVDRYAGNTQWEGSDHPATKEEILDRLGVFLGETVLGPEIMAALTASRMRRTLLIHLPNTAENPLAAAFARVPWEIARSSQEEDPLLHQALIVRMVTEDTAEPDSLMLAEAQKVADGEVPLKALFVFAEAPGSRPLSMRLERDRLRDLFFRDVLPRHNVRVDFLCHGVTREALRRQIQEAEGYHILHWSGHGHLNRLELLGGDGKADRITGPQLADLFAQAGGFIPYLVFLSSCLSGTFIDVKSWEQLQALATGTATGAEAGADTADPAATPDGTPSDMPTDKGDRKADDRLLDHLMTEENGYTGTALTLLRSGVPQVAAMRYEVGDDYARELALGFYRHLLADTGGHTADGALSLARGDLLEDAEEAARLGVINHATPLMFGQSGRLVEPKAERSGQLAKRDPKPWPLLSGGAKELDPRPDFTGRGRELTRLNLEWLAPGGPAAAVIQGLAGMGKTALASEAIHLWHPRFQWVFAFQSKPAETTVEEFFRQMDQRLALESKVYGKRVAESPYARIFLEPDPHLPPEARYPRMRTNLIAALRDEAALIVLDNFETNLKDFPDGDGYACRNPEWDALLTELAAELPATDSRLLITTRHLPAALAGNPDALWLPLGPLPFLEAAVFVRSHEGLRLLIHKKETGKALLRRLLSVTRCHPLILNRLAALAGEPAELDRALDTLETQGYHNLPDLFAGAADQKAEWNYLEEVAAGAVDFLIQRLSPEARRLLWMVTLANEPVTEEMMAAVWDGLSVGELLNRLHVSGLISRETDPAAEAETPVFSFHELVRERMAEWMAARPDETGARTREAVWIAYGERYAAIFDQIRASGKERAMETAAEAGRRALVYMVRAGAYDKLGSFASGLVTGTSDPALLRGVIAELKGVADALPAGKTRWSVRTYLADALWRSGRPDEALPFYEPAAAEAGAAGHWSHVGTICGNWAGALLMVGRLAESKGTHLKSAEAYKTAGSPEINVIGRELEAFRIDVYQGHAETALPEIESRLETVRGWWQRRKAGESVPEAPDDGFLARVLVGGLDIAEDANWQLENWNACLKLLEEIEQTKRDTGQSRHEQMRTRFNKYLPLIKLGRLDDARRVQEECLAVFREVGDLTNQSKALSALATVWKERGDIRQAIELERRALDVCNRLPDPGDRAISHLNLGNYLDNSGMKDESANHHLAAGIYYLCTGRHEPNWMGNLRNRIRREAKSNSTYALPRIPALLAHPEFEPLKRWLTERGEDLEELQGRVDGLVGEAESAANSQTEHPMANMPEPVKQAMARLIQAAQAGEDVAPLAADLRTKLNEAFPGEESEVDQWVDRLVEQLGGTGK
jgi:tetratricopeptide (TPR) repeat protein